MTTPHKFKSNRNVELDNAIVDALRAVDQPCTSTDLAMLMGIDTKKLSARLPQMSIKLSYPIWRLRGVKANSSLAQYVYSDTQPYNAVRKNAEWDSHNGGLQSILDRDLTMAAEEAKRAQRKLERQEKPAVQRIPVISTPAGAVADAVEKYVAAHSKMTVYETPVPQFELLEERDTDTIIFKFNGRVFVGKPVRI